MQTASGLAAAPRPRAGPPRCEAGEYPARRRHRTGPADGLRPGPRAADAAMTHSGIVAGTPITWPPSRHAARRPTRVRISSASAARSTRPAWAIRHSARVALAVLRRVSDDARAPPRAESRCPRLAGNDHRPADGQGPGPAVPDRERGCGRARPMPGSRPATPGIALPDGLEHGPTTKLPGLRTLAIGRGRGLRDTTYTRGRSLGRPVARAGAGADPTLGAGHVSIPGFELKETGGRESEGDRFRRSRTPH